MPGIKTPVILSLVVITVGATLVLSYLRSSAPTPKDHFEAIVAMMACVGGLVSAIFVVFAYYHSIWTMVEDRRPRLLLQIVSAGLSADGHPMSRVNYQNSTNNHFDDLRIHLLIENVRVGRVELASLFPEAMVMPPGDSRQRTFDPVVTLQAHGLDLLGSPDQGEIRLLAEYSYRFRQKPHRMLAQRYKWDWGKRAWELP